jgi:hypothetical protein
MGAREKDELVPQELLEPGFEGRYTGATDIAGYQSDEHVTYLADPGGDIYMKYSAWGFAHATPDSWNDEIRCINALQGRLGQLDEKARRTRQHLASLQCCDSGMPVTIDETLNAIGTGALPERPFHAGCWMSLEQRTTQPGETAAMQLVEEVLRGYLTGQTVHDFLSAYPHARGFIERTCQWLGDPSELTQVQRLLLERMLLMFDYLTRRNPDCEMVLQDCFREGGRGEKLDAQIAELAGLPRIYPNYRHEFEKALAGIDEPQKRELYKICGCLAHGLHELSDCHHSTYRWLERWIHAIGTLTWDLPGRMEGREGNRLGRTLFGYALGLDRWLRRVPHQFLLLDLGYVDLGFDPAGEVKRVYAYLGDVRSPVQEWLAACLWYKVTLEPPASLYKWGWRHKDLLARADEDGITVRTWMDSALGMGT